MWQHFPFILSFCHASLPRCIFAKCPTNWTFFFPQEKISNLQTCKCRFLKQNTSAKRQTFNFWDAFYVDAHFSLIMHAGSSSAKPVWSNILSSFAYGSKRTFKKIKTTPKDIIRPNGNDRISFTLSFKCLGSNIPPLLDEEAKIKTTIRKLKSIMGLTMNFFKCFDVDIRTNIRFIQLALMGPD